MFFSLSLVSSLCACVCACVHGACDHECVGVFVSVFSLHYDICVFMCSIRMESLWCQCRQYCPRRWSVCQAHWTFRCVLPMTLPLSPLTSSTQGKLSFLWLWSTAVQRVLMCVRVCMHVWMCVCVCMCVCMCVCVYECIHMCVCVCVCVCVLICVSVCVFV